MRTAGMMTVILLAFTLVLAGFSTTARAEFAPPTDAALDAMLANPATITAAFKDATPVQAADIVKRAIGKIQAANVSEAQKKKAIAIFVAMAVDAMQTDATAMMAILVTQVDADILPVVVAAAVTVARNADAMLAAIIAALGPGTDAAAVAQSAAESPQTILGVNLYRLLLALVTQHLTPISLVPLPPVAEKYPGQ